MENMTMAFTTLEGQVLKISGQAIGPSGTIAAGTQLSQARLTTIDFVDSGSSNDGLSFSFGEALSLRVNGVQISSTTPTSYATLVNTNTGSFTALAFVVGNDTYLLPVSGTNLTGVTNIATNSTLNGAGQAITHIDPASYGLIPENADTYIGQAFTQSSFGGQLQSGSLGSMTLHDADGIRGNADSAGEEVISGGFVQSLAREVVATVQLKNGQLLAVNAWESVVNLSYGQTNASYFFDENALAAQGKTIADVAQVLSSSATDHNLNWEELGFNFQSEGSGNFTPDPAAPPPPPPPNYITGTNAANTLAGTAGVDVIRGLGGNDTLRGGADGDFFVFGNETRNGRRDTDVIRDFEVNSDKVIIEDLANVTSITNIAGGVRIVFQGDVDRLDVLGTNVSRFNTGVFFDDDFAFI
jgi:RTX calcium-binding nonapeptide repeat (4 copies)